MQNRIEAGNNHWIRSRRIEEKDCFFNLFTKSFNSLICTIMEQR